MKYQGLHSEVLAEATRQADLLATGSRPMDAIVPAADLSIFAEMDDEEPLQYTELPEPTGWPENLFIAENPEKLEALLQAIGKISQGAPGKAKLDTTLARVVPHYDLATKSFASVSDFVVAVAIQGPRNQEGKFLLKRTIRPAIHIAKLTKLELGLFFGYPKDGQSECGQADMRALQNMGFNGIADLAQRVQAHNDRYSDDQLPMPLSVK